MSVWTFVGRCIEWVLETLGLKPKGKAEGFQWFLNGATQENTMAQVLLTIDHKLPISIQPVDRQGNPAKVDGAPVWTVSDPTVGEIVELAADGLSCVFNTLAAGVAQIAVSADADLGAGVRTISGTLDVQIESGEAVRLAILAGAPVAK